MSADYNRDPFDFYDDDEWEEECMKPDPAEIPKVYLVRQYDALFSTPNDILGASADLDALKSRMREYVKNTWYQHSEDIPLVDTVYGGMHLKELQYREDYQGEEIRISKDGYLICCETFRWEIITIELDKELR